MSVSAADLADGIFLSIEAYAQPISNPNLDDSWTLFVRDASGLSDFTNSIYCDGEFIYDHPGTQAIIAIKASIVVAVSILFHSCALN
jgi:hypothetical protein